MNKPLTIITITLSCVLCAAVVSAYKNPTSAFPTDTDVVPVTIGRANQIKAGGLSVHAFTANNAEFKDIVIVEKNVRGGTIGTLGNSTVEFGDWDTKTPAVSVVVQDDTKTNDVLSSDLLKGTGQRPVCADASGMVFECI